MLRFFRDLSESRSELLHRSGFDLVPLHPGEWGSGLLTEVIAPQRDPRFQLQLILFKLLLITARFQKKKTDLKTQSISTPL